MLLQPRDAHHMSDGSILVPLDTSGESQNNMSTAHSPDGELINLQVRSNKMCRFYATIIFFGVCDFLSFYFRCFRCLMLEFFANKLYAAYCPD